MHRCQGACHALFPEALPKRPRIMVGLTGVDGVVGVVEGLGVQ